MRAVAVVPGGGPQGSEVDGDTPPNAVAAQLRHVDTTDKSKPLLDPNVHVQKVRREAVHVYLWPEGCRRVACRQGILCLALASCGVGVAELLFSASLDGFG